MRSSPLIRTVLALGACAAALVVPTTATAGDASVFGGFLFVATTSDNQPNQVVVAVSPSATHVRITEFGLPTLLADDGCSQVVANKVVDCPAGAVAQGAVLLGPGDDELSYQIALPVEVSGGDDDDELAGGPAGDRIRGNPGNDTLDGNGGDDVLSDGETNAIGSAGGNDTLNGGPGGDRLDGGLYGTDLIPGGGRGADTLDGGADIDTADYSRRTAPLTITEGSGSGNDGQGGEGDTLADAETILLGSGGDSVRGSADANTLRGNGGDDTLDGGGGGDVLDGGTGVDTATYASRVNPVVVTLDGAVNDGENAEGDNVEEDVEVVIGGFVADDLTGSDGGDTLRGNGGPDTLTGGAGDDTLEGGEGGDTILARDGSVDTIACGDGADTVTADTADVVAADCETVDRPPVAAPPGGGGGGDGNPPLPPVTVDIAAPVFTLPAKVKLDRTRRLLLVDVACPAAEPTGCRGGRLVVTYTPKRKKGARRAPRAKTLKTVTWSAAGGERTQIVVKLSKGDTSAIRAAKKVKLALTARDASGNSGSAQRTARVS